MHFEILVEDYSGKCMLENLVPKIIGENHTFRIISYKGLGQIPRKIKNASEAKKRILLDQLPKLLNGYGRTFAAGGNDFSSAVIVVCDLDDKCLKIFRGELLSVLKDCKLKPNTRFCIAVEEGEAWYLGDKEAIKKAYPKAKTSILNSYVNDSICGTWELLADAIYPGGSRALAKGGWQKIGKMKNDWAKSISPMMEIERNQSQSFCYFKDKLKDLIQ